MAHPATQEPADSTPVLGPFETLPGAYRKNWVAAGIPFWVFQDAVKAGDCDSYLIGATRKVVREDVIAWTRSLRVQ